MTAHSGKGTGNLQGAHARRGRGARSCRATRLRQHAGLPRLDGDLSDDGRHHASARPLFLRHARHPTTEALESAWSDISGAAGTVLVPSGLAACALALMSCLKAGDHLLVTDSAYRPDAQFCNTVLRRFGVETTYYDPLIGAGIASPDEAEHESRLHRSAGLAHLRGAGHPGARRGRACTRRGTDHGQHLGDAVLLSAV